MESKRGAHSADVIDENSPEGIRRRKRFWRIWVAVNVLVIFVVAPSVYMLLGDTIVQIADDGTHTRAQAAVGVYMLGVAGTFCTLLPVNVIALILGLLARSGRMRRSQPELYQRKSQQYHSEPGNTGRQYSTDT
jgi:hypothetical protein